MLAFVYTTVSVSCQTSLFCIKLMQDLHAIVSNSWAFGYLYEVFVRNGFQGIEDCIED